MSRIRRLFIANRGEIARRIALTARRLGIETVCVKGPGLAPGYLADIATRFIQVPDENTALYLNAERMLALAQEAGADAVHPGFGFLSEHAGFAALIVKAGLTWVGPKSDAIAAMASKATARDYAERAHVPCVRGISGFVVPQDEHGDFAQLNAFAAAAGFPLLLKAALGGGGKGMRVVNNLAELPKAALRAASEAFNSFGDGTLICEQYLTEPRHVEVQILADQHGRVVAIGDRDCSVQRRHQKILEEAPAPNLGPKTRQALHEAAINLAAAVGYDSAGTVEFLVDWSKAGREGPEQRFFFLEMNTRLQVEHPVSEEVFGLDLVEWQLRVAQGEALPAHFQSLTPRGHSIEVRLYAEDVGKDFFPAPGPVAAFFPAHGPGLRWELGLNSIDEVTGGFDPMVAKLVATGDSRQAALSRLGDGLRRTVFAGPPSNAELVQTLVGRSEFAAGPVTTHYLTKNLAELLRLTAEPREAVAGIAEQLFAAVDSGALKAQAPAAGADSAALTAQAFAIAGGSAGLARQPAEVKKVTADAATWQILSTAYQSLPAAGKAAAASSHFASGLLTRPDATTTAFWYAAWSRADAAVVWVSVDGYLFRRDSAKVSSARSGRAAAAGNDILAPVPGKVIAVLAAVGGKVAEGDTVLVLESMKMEFEVKAAKSGALATLHVKAGDQVTAGQKLAVWAE